MPIDASIYSRIRTPTINLPGPMDQYAQMMQLRDLMEESGMRGLQRRKLEQEHADEMQIRDLMQQSGGDTAKLRESLSGAGRYKEVLALDKSNLERETAQAGLSKTLAETAKSQDELLRQELVGVNDQAGWLAWREEAMRIKGRNIAGKIPEVYDPEMKNNLIMKADEYIERQFPKLAQRDTGGHIENFNPYTAQAVGGAVQKTPTPEAVMTDTRTRAEGAAGRAVTVRGQNLTDARAAESARIAASGKSAERVSDLRKEFNALPAVKAYDAVQPVLQSAREAASVDTGAADLNMIYAAAKIMDPTSVVRESETAMVIASGSPSERFLGQFNYVAGGGRLTAKARESLLAEIESRARGFESGYKATRKTYEGIADKGGLSKDEVFVQPFMEPQSRAVPTEGGRRATDQPSSPEVESLLEKYGGN